MATLPDLAQVVATTAAAIDTNDPLQQVSLSKTKFDLIIKTCQDLYSGETVHGVGGHTLGFMNNAGQTRNVSVQDFPLLVALAELDRALKKYKIALDDIATEMGFTSRSAGSAIFGKLPNSDLYSVLDASQQTRLFNAINVTLPDPQDNAHMVQFLSDPEWGGLADDRGNVGRKLDRSTDWMESAVFKIGKMVATANAGRYKLINALAEAGIKSSDLIITPAILPPANNLPTGPRETGGDNILYYGAPGTGKSHKVDTITQNSTIFRTVFHPETQNADFVGTLKPGTDDGEISYSFRPGPFAKAYMHAWLHPNQKTYLVIEELNRAQAAAVFGELFQLLDRTDDGTGRYSVDFPSPEFAQWAALEGGAPHAEFKLPSNLWILATMNSADQGVFALDTAFRRRWQQIYIPIDYGITPAIDINLGKNTYSLVVFLTELNNFLANELNVAEDRLVGPRFIDAREIKNGQLPGKLLIYLWDDLLRHGGRLKLFENTIKTYGQLHERTASGVDIFTSSFLTRFQQQSTLDDAAPDNTPSADQGDLG